MNNEIKEILDIERYRNKDGYVENINLTPDELHLLLDYITNLEEENEELNNKFKKIKEVINYYAIEDEDYSKIYNDEEKELLKVLDGDE
ncbi:MAG: hypothetical protein IKU37_01495 [Candidatus Gastranaerophilales bacterium]|nr:hypothetical protein [Candidatus Gastranaerophilales bacterium]